MGPQNYNIDVASPIQRAMAEQDRRLDQANRDRQFGLQTRQLDIRESQNAQRQKNYEQQFGYQQSQDATRAAAIEEKKVAAQAKMKAISDFAERPDKTAKDYSDMINAHPEFASAFKGSYELMSEGQKATSAKEAAQIYSSIESGAPEVAESILTRRMEAAKNSGDLKGEAGAKATLEILRSNPDAAKTTMGLFLASADPKAFAALEKVSERKYQRGRNAATDARAARAEQRAINTDKRADKRLDAAVKREMRIETAAAKKAGKPRNTTTAEMQSLFAYGDEQNVDMKGVSKILNETRGQPIEDRLAAIDAAATGDTKAEKVAKSKTAKTSGLPERYSGTDWTKHEGKSFKVDETGETYKIVNGKPQKV